MPPQFRLFQSPPLAQTSAVRPFSLSITTFALATVLLSCAPRSRHTHPPFPAARIELTNQPVELPAEIIEGRIILQLTVNGTGPWQFFFDTGSELEGVRSTLIASMHLRPMENVKLRINDNSGGHVLCEPADFQLGPVQYRSSVIGASDVFDQMQHWEGRRVDGILGAGLLSVANVHIDYDNQKLILTPPNSPVSRGTRIHTETRRHRRYMPVEFSLAGKSTNGPAMIDTGHGGSLGLGLDTLRALGLSPHEQGWLELESITLTKRDPAWAGRLDHIVLGPHTLASPTFMARAHRSGDEGIIVLGSPLLSRFNTTYTRDAIYLEPNKTFSEPSPFDASGLGISAHGENFQTFLVAFVRPDSPAAESGLFQKGDQLLALDNQPASEWRLWTLRKHLREHGHTCELLVRRDNQQQHTATLNLRNDLK